jgi:hypothetical protein
MRGRHETAASIGGAAKCQLSLIFSLILITISCGAAFTQPAAITLKRRRIGRLHPLRASILEEIELIERVNNFDSISTKVTSSERSRRNSVDEKKTLASNVSGAKHIKLNDESKVSSDKIRSARSKQRLIKAQKLLEMAQVSPSQRLEMEEARLRGTNSASLNGRRVRTSSAAIGLNNTKDMYQMRMAGTFDSVDNLVDSKSLLPGGRWVDEEVGSAVNSDSLSSEMDLRKIASYGQVAEVRC